MATFVTAVVAASKKVGGALKVFVAKAGRLFAAAKRKVREYRLFSKGKTKAAKDRMVAQMTTVIEKVQRTLGRHCGAFPRKRRRGCESTGRWPGPGS